MHYLLCLPQTYNNEQQSTRITKAHYEHHRDRVSYLRQSFLGNPSLKMILKVLHIPTGTL